MKKEVIDKFLADCNGLSRREFMRRAALLSIAAPASGLYGSALAATTQKCEVFNGLAGDSTADTLDSGGMEECCCECDDDDYC